MAGTTEGRLRTLQHVEPEFVSATRGPVALTFDSSANQTLVAAPGVGFAIAVTSIQISMNKNSDTDVIFKAGAAGATRVRFKFKGDRIGPPFTMNPPWLLTENSALVCQRLEGAQPLTINVMFYTVEL